MAMASTEDTHNRGVTVIHPPHGGTLRPFQKGNRANPGGRPKGITSYVRGKTKDGKLLADFFYDILMRQGEFAGARIPLKVRMEAARELWDRGHGKPIQATELTGKDGGPIEQQTTVNLGVEVRAVDYRLAAAPLRPALAPPEEAG